MHRHHWNACICWTLFVASVAAAGRAEETKKPTLEELVKDYGPGFTIRVVDEDKKPVTGALAGRYGYFRDGNWRNGLDDFRTTDTAGDLHFDYGRNDLSDWCIFARHDGRQLAGFANANMPDVKEGKAVEVVVTPSRHVRGRLTCSKLNISDEADRLMVACVWVGKIRALEYATWDATYDFLLPAGDYELDISGRYEGQIRRPLHIELGDGDLVIDTIDLPPTQLGLLRGKPAPELRGVVGWKNTAGLKLSGLKGRYVLLDFWGYWCSPCVAGMPKLFAIRDRFPEDKLAIVGVHVSDAGEDQIDSSERLDAAVADSRKTLWHGRDLPFPVALVKAETTPYAEADVDARVEGVEIGHARSQAAADYGIMGYPTTVLIDRVGNVVGDAREFVDSDEGVAKLVKLIGD